MQFRSTDATTTHRFFCIFITIVLCCVLKPCYITQTTSFITLHVCNATLLFNDVDSVAEFCIEKRKIASAVDSRSLEFTADSKIILPAELIKKIANAYVYTYLILYILFRQNVHKTFFKQKCSCFDIGWILIHWQKFVQLLKIVTSDIWKSTYYLCILDIEACNPQSDKRLNKTCFCHMYWCGVVDN